MLDAGNSRCYVHFCGCGQGTAIPCQSRASQVANIEAHAATSIWRQVPCFDGSMMGVSECNAFGLNHERERER
jgi:hypothetical protein